MGGGHPIPIFRGHHRLVAFRDLPGIEKNEETNQQLSIGYTLYSQKTKTHYKYTFLYNSLSHNNCIGSGVWFPIAMQLALRSLTIHWRKIRQNKLLVFVLLVGVQHNSKYRDQNSRRCIQRSIALKLLIDFGSGDYRNRTRPVRHNHIRGGCGLDSNADGSRVRLARFFVAKGGQAVAHKGAASSTRYTTKFPIVARASVPPDALVVVIQQRPNLKVVGRKGRHPALVVHENG